MNALAKTFTGKRDGRTKHSLYNTHQMMVRRCYEPTFPNYKDYGAKGVTVCDEWLGEDGFWKFVEDMGFRPEGLTVDRIDPEGSYCKANCRWTSKNIQANNTRLTNKLNSSGSAGVHWCERDNSWVVQVSLNGTRKCIGRFGLDEKEKAEQVYLQAKEMKIAGTPDSEIIDKLVKSKIPNGSKGALKRNKTSKYWGVSLKAKTGKWVAFTDKYLGIRATEEEAYSLVLKWIEEQEANKIGSTIGPDNS